MRACKVHMCAEVLTYLPTVPPTHVSTSVMRASTHQLVNRGNDVRQFSLRDAAVRVRVVHLKGEF